MLSNIKLYQSLIFFASLITFAFLSFFHQVNLLGQAALILLTLIMLIRPLAKVFPTVSIFKTLLVLRRQIGQASAFAVFGHVYAQVFPDYGLISVLNFDLSSGPGSFTFWGFWGLVTIIPLLLTSNDFSVRFLGQNWKRIQWLVHPLYLFVMLHWGLRDGSSGLIKSGLLLFLIYGIRLLARLSITFPQEKPASV